MGQDAGRRLVGLVVHDARIALTNVADNDGATLNSDFTEAGPRPGSAIAGDATSTADPQVSAAQTNDLDFRVVQGGNAEIDGAGLAYRLDGEADSSFRGHNEPNVATHWDSVEFTSTESWEFVAAVTIPSTQDVVAFAHDTDASLDNSSWTYTASTTVVAGPQASAEIDRARTL